MIILHCHLQPQFIYELFHINFTSYLSSVDQDVEQVSIEVIEWHSTLDAFIMHDPRFIALKEIKLFTDQYIHTAMLSWDTCIAVEDQFFGIVGMSNKSTLKISFLMFTPRCLWQK